MIDAEKFQNAKPFLRRVWHLENDKRPGFQIGYVGENVLNGTPVKSALFSVGGAETVKDRLQNPEIYLKAQLTEIEGQLALQGDFVPSLCPAFGVIGIPSAFGCPVMWWENDFPAVRPALSDDPMKVYDLPKPSVNAGELSRVLEYTEYFLKQTHGMVPIRLTDIQGPLDSATLIFGHNNFLTALMTNPAEVHHLLKMVTELTIDFVKKQRELVIQAGAEFVPAMFMPWIEDGFGISVSNDECVMISSEMHDEFHVPYLSMLAEEFGGIYLHSCGNWTHQFSSIEKIHNLRGVEFGASETPYAQVFDRFGGKIVTACRVGFNQETKFAGMKDYVSKILNAKKTNRGLFINVDVTNGMIDEAWGVTNLAEIYEMIYDAR